MRRHRKGVTDRPPVRMQTSSFDAIWFPEFLILFALMIPRAYLDEPPLLALAIVRVFIITIALSLMYRTLRAR